MINVQARNVLWHLAFVGFAINYMIRINVNITIVEMVATKGKSQLPTTADILDNMTTLAENINEIMQLNASNVTIHTERLNQRPTTRKDDKYSLEKHLLNLTNIQYDNEGFPWNEYKQGLVLGSFYWTHWITQIPGGILAKKYGTKLVFGLSNAIGCWMCFLIPLASYWDYRALIWLRMLQGLVAGLAWPAMHGLTAKWIPPNERSKFVTAYLGGSVGTASFYPLFGYMLHWASWEWVYHVCGILGTLWWLGWLIFAYDSPAQHPRISATERRYIEKSLGASVQTSESHAQGIPWKAIFTSRPVWMNVIAQWGGIWGLFTLMTQAPTYFTVIHKINIKNTGILSGLPHLMRMAFAFVFSLLADFLLKSNKMSRTNLRKLATAICCIVNGLVVVALAYFGHNSTAAIVFLTAATMFHGAVSSGPLASIVDIAPNFAGIVLGICGTISGLPGFISPYIVGILTLDNQTFEAWKNIFLICATMLIGSGVLYVLFAESNLQDWNGHSTRNDDKELQLLNKQTDINDCDFEKEPLKAKLKKDLRAA